MVADLESDKCSHIPEDGSLDRLSHLIDILVRHRERELILASLREDCGEAVSGEVLELIDIESEVSTFSLRSIGTGHRLDLELGHHHGSEESTRIFSDASLRQIHYEDLSIIHDPPEREGIFWLTEDVAQYG